jgi:hypothetical protein
MVFYFVHKFIFIHEVAKIKIYNCESKVKTLK